MNFRVVPPALAELTNTVRGDAAAVRAANGYAGSATPLKHVGLLFLAVATRHQEAVAALRASLDHLESTLIGSARELGATGDSYTHMDQQNAAALDAAYPTH